jgi:hypothetical protein
MRRSTRHDDPPGSPAPSRGLAVLLPVLCLVLASCSGDSLEGPYTHSSLEGVWSGADGFAWAVGMDGWQSVVLRAEGQTWTDEELLPGERLFDVSGRSADDVYTIGRRDPDDANPDMILMRWDGLVWSLFAEGLSTSLTEVWCGPDSALILAGRAGRVQHWEAVLNAVDSTVTRQWVNSVSGTGQDLLDLWGAADTDVFAVGRGGTIVHFDGGEWSMLASDTTLSLYGVHGRAGDDVYAVGEKGLILHYDGAAWTPQDSLTAVTLLAVWAAPDGTAFAAGHDGTILHNDGQEWVLQREGHDEDLVALWGRAGDDVWVVGRRYAQVVLDGLILHWDGTGWTRLDVPLAQTGGKGRVMAPR